MPLLITLSFIAASLIGATVVIALSSPKIGPAEAIGDDFTFAAVGDDGCTSHTSPVMNAIAGVLPERVLGLGDYAYAQDIDQCWHRKISSPATVNDNVHNNMHDTIDGKWRTVALGNHETATTCTDPAPPAPKQCFYLSPDGRNAFLAHFGLSESSTYYSYNYKGVHFLVLDSESPFLAGTQQHIFVEDDLVSARQNPSINWIVAYFHRPMYASTGGAGGDTDLRTAYQPLFDKYRVDLVLQAHIHAYERLHPMTYDGIISDTGIDRTYFEPKGQVYVTVGTGGADPKSTWQEANKLPSSAFQDSIHYGFLKVDITNNGKTMTGRFIDADNPTGLELDKFTINHNDKYDNAPYYLLDGANFFDVPNKSAEPGKNQLAGEFSVASWFRTSEDYSTHQGMIANKGGFGPTAKMNYGIWMEDSSGKENKVQAGFTATNGTPVKVTSTQKYNDGKWHYAVVTFKINQGSNELTLYVDGALIGQPVLTSLTPDSSSTLPFRIGANSDISGGGRYFIGDIDEARVWNSALTAADVTAAYNGSPTTTGQVIYKGNSFEATGSNYFDVADRPGPDGNRLTQFSVAAWFKTSKDYNGAPGQGMIANKGGLGGTTSVNMNYGMRIDNGLSNTANKISAGFEKGDGTGVSVRSPLTYNDNKWHYGVVSYDGANVILYIDGKPVGDPVPSLGPPDNNDATKFRIGANGLDPAARWFTGNIDEVRVWNRALTQTEVIDQFIRGQIVTTGQVEYLPFECTKVSDNSALVPC